MRFLKGGLRFFLVTAGIVVLTSFSIDASDALRGSQTALSLFADKATQSECPQGSALVELLDTRLCIDIYENSVAEACPVQQPVGPLDTKQNIDTAGCTSVSQSDVMPWTQVTYHQAKTLCAKRDMRLPSADEWYEGALGTPDAGVCNVAGTAASTGAYTECVSARGMYDAVGNMWEWVDAEAVDGQYQQRSLPPSGYVTTADGAGIALTTTESPDELHGNDYFWSDAQGTYGVIRGGFYGSEDDAGMFATHMKIENSFAGVATGFRCVKNM